MAAVLACGDGAVLSHGSAAATHGFRRPHAGALHVTIPARSGRSRPGIRIHRAPALSERDKTIVRSIPTTTPARTLLDIAETLDRRQLERAIDEAHLLCRCTRQDLADAIANAPTRKGASLLAALLDDHQPGTTFTRSELEERFLALVAAAGLPTPRTNLKLTLDDGTIEVDFAWPEQRLIAETDGHATHSTRRAFERDRQRDQRLLLAGWRVTRFTWRQVERQPGQTADTVRTLLATSARDAPRSSSG